MDRGVPVRCQSQSRLPDSRPGSGRRSIKYSELTEKIRSTRDVGIVCHHPTVIVSDIAVRSKGKVKNTSIQEQTWPTPLKSWIEIYPFELHRCITDFDRATWLIVTGFDVQRM